MKKLFIIAAFLLSTGLISSCTKDNVAPTAKTVATNSEDTETGGGLGTGDGGIDRPVRKP